MKKLIMAKVRAMDTERCKGGVHVTRKQKPRPFDEGREPLSAGKLVIHKDGTFSVLVLRPNRRRRWIWLHWSEQIQMRDFARLSVADRKRIRAFEERTGREVVVRDFDY